MSHIGVFVIVLTCFSAVVEGTAPVFENLNANVNVGALEVANRNIFIPIVTDPNQDPVTCTGVISASPYTAFGDEFTFLLNIDTGHYELDVAPPAAPFNDSNTYFITITCTDGVQTSVGSCTVSIIPNQNVFWNTLPATVTKNVNTVTPGSLIDTAQATNTLGNPMKYYLHAVSPDLPGNDPFFQVDPSTGEVTAVQNLNLISYDTRTVYIDIMATDEQINMTERITLQLEQQNHRPTTDELPLAQTQLESIASGTVLFTMTCDDADGDTTTVSHSCDPKSMETVLYFDNLNNRFEIAAGKNLDYENAARYVNCTFICNDGLHDSDHYTYELFVANANDAPEFDNTLYHVTIPEGSAGSSTVDAGMVCTDEDSKNGNEPLTYSFTTANNSDRFQIDENGISFRVNYDLEAGYPSSVYVTALCCDDGDQSGSNLCDTAQVLISISGVNDNDPSFPSKSYTVYADNTMTPGVTVVGSFSPTDPDSGSDGDTSCSCASGSGHSATYACTSSCDIILAATPTFDYGTTVTYIMEAVDDGNPQRTGTTTVDVVYREADTTTTTTTAATTTAYNFFSRPENIAMFTLLLLALLGLLALGLYFCLRCCCGGMCGGGANMCDCYGRNACCQRRYPPRQVTPVTPPKTPPPREKTPRTPPPRIIQRPQRVGVIQTIARPAYGGWRQVPAGPQFLRTAPTLLPPPAYAP